MTTGDIYNAIRVNEQILTGGQPTEDQLKAASAEGFTAVINLATYDSRSLPDEDGLVQSLNMEYIHIPVVWQAPQQIDFEEFEQAMNRLPGEKTLIHCAANFRVTAFYSLYAQKHLGWSEAQAEALLAKIWADREEPVWENFIASVKATF
jgi:protein tyrosine phosphatase (PTP) superfamily phosphohydrolase (DUF442 family)